MGWEAEVQTGAWLKSEELPRETSVLLSSLPNTESCFFVGKHANAGQCGQVKIIRWLVARPTGLAGS